MTRSAMAVVFLVIHSLVAVTASDTAFIHVRGLDAWANESLERGHSRSSLTRRLLASFDASDVIVHVESSELMPFGIAGMTRFATVSGGYRFVRITLDRRLEPNMRAATLAHELQHAREVAESGAQSQRDLERLFQQIGFRVAGTRTFYETAEAAQTGLRAWTELRGGAVTERPGQ